MLLFARHDAIDGYATSDASAAAAYAMPCHAAVSLRHAAFIFLPYNIFFCCR